MVQKPGIKDKILETAWQLFVEKGYEKTTVDEIINLCGTSKGGFYHYFSAKDDLLIYISMLLDQHYVYLTENINLELSVRDKLFFYTEESFRYIENNIPSDILALELSAQVTKTGIKHLLDERRYYFSILTVLISQGQSNGEFSNKRTTRELVKLYAMQERAVLYDWCICDGNYPLSAYGVEMFKMFIKEALKPDYLSDERRNTNEQIRD